MEVVHVIVLNMFLRFCSETIHDSPVLLLIKAEKSVYALLSAS